MGREQVDWRERFRDVKDIAEVVILVATLAWGKAIGLGWPVLITGVGCLLVVFVVLTWGRRRTSADGSTLVLTAVPPAAVGVAALAIHFLGRTGADGALSVAGALVTVAVAAVAGWLSALSSSRGGHTAGGEATGFAVTGVVVAETGPGAVPRFLLINNRNLNNGQGLWLPPGGHLDVSRERPVERLVEKIRAETGYTVALHPEVPTEPLGTDTEATTWLERPFCILEEEMMPVCSQGHDRHIDLVYVCRVVSGQRADDAKYGHPETAFVPLEPCAASIQSARDAIESAIDLHEEHHAGRRRGRRDNITLDLVERLHLVARRLADPALDSPRA